MTDRPTFTITLRAEPDVDSQRALRQLLKVAARSFGLRCLSVQQADAQKPVTQNGKGSQAR